jgi:hypothetical protein
MSRASAMRKGGDVMTMVIKRPPSLSPGLSEESPGVDGDQGDEGLEGVDGPLGGGGLYEGGLYEGGLYEGGLGDDGPL